MLNYIVCSIHHFTDKAGITLLNNEDYLNIFHEIKNSITLVNGSLQLVAKKHPEVCEFDYWNEAMSEISFLKKHGHPAFFGAPVQPLEPYAD